MVQTATASGAAAVGTDHGTPDSLAGGRSLDHIWRTTREQIGFILLVTLIVAGAATIAAMLIPIRYTTSAEILIEARKSNVTGENAVVTVLPNDPVTIQNQIRVLDSRNLASEVIAKLGLNTNPEFATPDSASNDRIVDSFLRHLSVQPLGLSSTISVAFTSQDPKLASDVANALADAYIDHQLNTNSQSARRAASWLTQRVAELAAETKAADAAVQAYKRAHNLADAADGTPLVDQELLTVQSELVQAEADLAEKRAQRERLHALAAAGDAADLSQVTASPTIQQLRQQEAQVVRDLADLESKYGPKHPKLIALQSAHKNLEDKIAAEITRIENSLENDTQVAEAQVHSLHASLSEVERLSANENLARVDLQSLEASAKSTRATYEAFVQRLREVQGQDAMQVPDASIISRAPVPNTPSSPRRSLIVLGSVPIGFLIGLLIALFRKPEAESHVRPTFPTFRAPVVARIPELGANADPRFLAEDVIWNPDTPFAHAMKAIRSSLSVSVGGGSILAIASLTEATEGSALAIGIARSAAQAGSRPIVIDCDGATRNILALDPAHPGASDVLSGRVAMKDAIQTDSLSGALILAPGQSTLPDVNQILKLAESLRQRTSLVIVNLPFACPAAAAAAILGRADGSLFIASAAEPAETANAAIAALHPRNPAIVLAA